MAVTAGNTGVSVAWWKEPTRDQWFAWIAGIFGWALDGFDYTIFLFIMVPIAQEFGVSVTAVAAVLAITTWMRFVGATGAGWLADRVGRKGPLMLSILGLSVCNFIAGFSPNFIFLFVVRAILGIAMGAEWPVGASLAMESWPPRSRGLMGALMQGGFPIGFALASLAYGLLFDVIGWRGLLWLCILPALACVFIRSYVKEPEVWVENRKRQREQKQEIRAPLLDLFKPALLSTTLIACWWAASFLVAYYSVFPLFAAWMQIEFNLGPAAVATPVLLSNLLTLGLVWVWGGLADSIGRRWSGIIQAAIGCAIAPVYLLTNDITWIFIGFVLQGPFAGSLSVLSPVSMSERFPTEVRSTANGFCYHLGTVVAGIVPPIVSYLAIEQHMGFAIPLLVFTWASSLSCIAALLFSPETKGKVLVSELTTKERVTPIATQVLAAEA